MHFFLGLFLFHFGLLGSGHPLGGGVSHSFFLLFFLLGLNYNFLQVLVANQIDGVLHPRHFLQQKLSVFQDVLLADDLFDGFLFLSLHVGRLHLLHCPFL